MSKSPEQTPREKRVLAAEAEGAAARYQYRDADALSASVVVAVGLTLVLIGVLDMLLAWLPLRFGVAGWEFATLSQTLTNLPVTLLGIGLVVFGFVRHPASRPRWLRVVAVLLGVAVLLLVVAGLLYLLAAVEVWRASPAEAQLGVIKAVLRNGFDIVLYPLLLGTLSWLIWKGVERVPG